MNGKDILATAIIAILAVWVYARLTEMAPSSMQPMLKF